jgi:hypothetical protein
VNASRSPQGSPRAKAIAARGRQALRALRATIRNRPPALEVAEAGHFTQEAGVIVVERAMGAFQLTADATPSGNSLPRDCGHRQTPYLPTWAESRNPA